MSAELDIIKAEIRGRIQGLNDARIRVWGFGYDNDETGQMMRQFTSKEITRLQEMLDINESIQEPAAAQKEVES